MYFDIKLNKFLPRRADVRTGGGALELNYKQNTPIIRLADTYLMEAEALGATGRTVESHKKERNAEVRRNKY